MWNVLCFTLLLVVVSSRILKLSKALKSVDHLPGLRCLFSPLGFPGVLLPNKSWNPGLSWTWHWRSLVYKQFKSETISVVPYLLGSPLVYTISLEVARQVMNSSQFFKERSTTRALAMWGENVITSEHEMYKRHRRIVGPAFSSAIAPLVWEETSKTYKEMLVDEGWSEKTTVTTECFNDYSQKLALILISRCAFGLPFPWSMSSSTRGESDLEKSIAVVSDANAIRGSAPRWIFKLPFKKLIEMEDAHATLENFMRSYITSQKTQLVEQDMNSKADLFSRLVEANEAEGKLVLDDEEVIGNVFAFLLAGHETTARTIAATLALLALHQEEQDIAVDEIRRVLINGRDAVYEDAPALTKVQACFSEATRLFPAGYVLIRDTLDHVTLVTPTDDGDKTIALAPGTRVVVDMIGTCYNPRHFKDPETFKPSRWYDVQESDLTFFGIGPRACLGRKFAMTEALCFLTLLLRDWVVSPLLQDGETTNEWGNRVLQIGRLAITFGVGSVPLKFTKRV